MPGAMQSDELHHRLQAEIEPPRSQHALQLRAVHLAALVLWAGQGKAMGRRGRARDASGASDCGAERGMKEFWCMVTWNNVE